MGASPVGAAPTTRVDGTKIRSGNYVSAIYEIFHKYDMIHKQHAGATGEAIWIIELVVSRTDKFLYYEIK